MAAAVLPPQKRALADATKAHRNVNVLPSPTSAKRRKLDHGPSAAAGTRPQKGTLGGPGSSQARSQFEDTLEKLTQDTSDLKHKNAEKDQQWDRPLLDNFDEKRDPLCFQQIEVEEGTLHGGRTAVKMFGVTEVSMRGAPSHGSEASLTN
jgi:DNA polymerase delta subunit 1